MLLIFLANEIDTISSFDIDVQRRNIQLQNGKFSLYSLVQLRWLHAM